MIQETAVAEVEQKPSIIALDPATYVAQVFAPFRAELTAAIVGDTDVQYDITSTAGMKLATQQRALFRGIRTGLESHRKEFKAPLLEAGRQLDEAAKQLTAEIEPFEQRHDGAIKAEEARKAELKRQKEAEEAARVQRIRGEIDAIRRLPVAAAASNAEAIASLIARAEEFTPSAETHAEFAGEGLQAKTETLVTLQTMLEQAQAREKAAAELAAQRRELELQRKADEARRAEAERAATAQRAIEESRLKAERERQAAELAAARADIERQRQQIEAEQQRQEAAAQAQRDAEEQARRKAAQEDADRLAAQEVRQRREEADLADAMERLHRAAPRLLCIVERVAELDAHGDDITPEILEPLIEAARAAVHLARNG